MIYGIIIFVVIVLIVWSGVFDSDSSEGSSVSKNKMRNQNPWKYNKTTAQLYFDIYVSEPSNGKYIILKIAENNFVAVDFLDFPPDRNSKNELLLTMDNRAYNFPEQNLSEILGVCHIKGKKIQIYFADKTLYHNGIKEIPFEYMSFEGILNNKTLFFDIKERYYDQSIKSSKIRNLIENLRFNQL